MSYTPEVTRLKMAIYTLRTFSGTGGHTQTGFSSTSWKKVDLYNLTTEYNPFEDNVTFTSSTDVINLPVGKYYLNGRLASFDSGNPYTHRWSQCTFYDYVADEAIGFAGREWQRYDYNRNPNANEHAKAFVESDGSRQIQFRAKASHTTLQVSQYDGNASAGRVVIWRLA